MWPTSPSSGINSILPIANTIAGFDNPATAATALGRDSPNKRVYVTAVERTKLGINNWQELPKGAHL